MNDYAIASRRPALTARRSLGSAVAATAMLTAVIMISACGSPGSGPEFPSSPSPAASQPDGQPGIGQRPPDDDGAGDGPGGGPTDEAAPTDPVVIEVTTEAPNAPFPCQPSGSIVVSGGEGGDSTQPGGEGYPVEVTYQWFVRNSSSGSPVPFGFPGTLEFATAGGIPVSAPELDPAPNREVELRVVEPESISGGWVVYSGCA